MQFCLKIYLKFFKLIMVHFGGRQESITANSLQDIFSHRSFVNLDPDPRIEKKQLNPDPDPK